MWPRRVCWLTDLSRVRQPLRRPVPGSSVALAHTAAEHPREQSGETVQQASRSAVGGEMRGPRCRAVQVPQQPGAATDAASARVDGHGHYFDRGVDQPDYASPPAFRLVWSCCHSCPGDPRGNILRISSAGGFNPAPPPSRANCSPLGTLGHQNRHALQSGDQFRPCQLPKNRRCPRESSVVPKAELTPPATPPSHQGQARS